MLSYLKMYLSIQGPNTCLYNTFLNFSCYISLQDVNYDLKQGDNLHKGPPAGGRKWSWERGGGGGGGVAYDVAISPESCADITEL